MGHLHQIANIVPGGSEAEKNGNAAAALAEMVGALVLARAVDDWQLASDLLAAARNDLTSRFGG